MRINDIVTNKQYILYLNGKPVSTYDNLKDARGEVYVLQQNNPNLDYEIKQEVCREEPLGLTKNTLVELGISKTRTFQKKGVAETGPFSYGKAPRKGSVADLAAKKRKEQEKGKPPIEPKDQMIGVAKVTKGVAEGPLQEFAPGSGGGDGRWYTDDEIADIIGEEWFDFDLSGEAANISIRGEHAKILLVQEAQAYFEDRGYHGVVVQDVRDDEDYLSWYISGNFTRSDEGVAEGLPGSLSKSDYTPGATKKYISTNCTTCQGRKVMYKTPDGKLHADNKQGAKKISCPVCKGTGDKQGVAEQAQICSECGGPSYSNPMLAEKKDACYHKVKSRVKVWPSAYASGQLVQCRKRGASNWGTGGKKK